MHRSRFCVFVKILKSVGCKFDLPCQTRDSSIRWYSIVDYAGKISVWIVNMPKQFYVLLFSAYLRWGFAGYL